MGLKFQPLLLSGFTSSSSSGGGGGVSSVALALPISVFTVSGSPVTSSGTLTGSFNTQSANTVFSGPASGGAAVPTFRSLVAADIPLIPITGGGTGQTTKSAAFDALSPMTTGGDIIYGGASGTGTRLANGSSGQVLTSNGGTSAPSWQTPTVGANRTLSNLTSPVATNQDILPGSDAVFFNGNASNRWVAVVTQQFQGYGVNPLVLGNNSAQNRFKVNIDATMPSGATANAQLTSSGAAGSVALGLMTQNETNPSTNSATVYIESGNASGTTSNSGNISIQTGTATGTRGKILLNGSSIDATTHNIINVVDPVNPQDAATKNYVDTHSSGANTSLSNLTTTSINQPLLPNADGTLDVGDISTPLQWNNVYAQYGQFSSGAVSPNGYFDNLNPNLGSVINSTAVIDMGANKITGVANPTLAQDAATKNYVDNVAAGINPAVAVQAATTSSSDTTGFTYNNGVGGIGATLTSNSNNTPLTVDGYTFTALGQRLLVKDHSTPANNGVYYVTQVQAALLPIILTRALDYDQPSDINNTGAIPVVNGTVNNTTQWVLTSLVNTVGTDALTFTRFTRNPSDYLLKSAGDINETSFTAADNQSSPANVTGLAFANATVRSFDVLLSIVRNTTYASYKLYGIQKGSSWDLNQSFVGDTTGLTFTITTAGQIQYTSTSTGSTALVKFRAVTTST